MKDINPEAYTGEVKTVNGISPDNNGDVKLPIPEADCDWNLMKNKPFYENITANLMFEVDVTLSRIQQFEGDYYSGTASTTFYLEDSPYYSYFKANKTYRVTIGDRVELFTQLNNSPTIKTDINSNGVFDSTCVGFFISRTGGQLLEVRLDNTYSNGESEITKHIIVEEVEVELKPLDEKYLPNSVYDWNRMENKPFYENLISVKPVFEVDVTLSKKAVGDSYYYDKLIGVPVVCSNLTSNGRFKANTTYRITIDDRTEYITIGSSVSSGLENGASYLEGVHISLYQSATVVGFALEKTYGDGGNTITKHIIVEEVEIELKKIDPKFLPDTHINELIDAKLEVIENGTY